MNGTFLLNVFCAKLITFNQYNNLILVAKLSMYSFFYCAISVNYRLCKRLDRGALNMLTLECSNLMYVVRKINLYFTKHKTLKDKLTSYLNQIQRRY